MGGRIYMTQFEALNIAYSELSNMIPYDGENDEVFEAVNVIEKMIRTKEKAMYRSELRKKQRSLLEYFPQNRH